MVMTVLVITQLVLGVGLLFSGLAIHNLRRAIEANHRRLARLEGRPPTASRRPYADRL